MTPQRERLEQRTLALVSVASPTGDTAAAARLYAGWLAEAGLEVELRSDEFPDTPTVIGLLRGGRPGPRLVLNGHLDTVPLAHQGAVRSEQGRIYGRGAADMKGALVAALEAAQLQAAAGAFAGELAIVAIGLHEAPSGRGEDLSALLDSGFRADYAVVCELCGHDLAVAHMGQATAEITISRPGMPTHELQTEPGTPHPLHAAAAVVSALGACSRELAQVSYPWVGAETYFVGELHGGDFYNRYPASCRIVGTRRWAPGRSLAEVEREYRSLLEPIAAASGCTIELDLRLVRDAYEIDPGRPLVAALRGAYREVSGEQLELVGMKTVADGAIWQGRGGIPTVYHGPVGSGAHADVEYIELDELERAARVYGALAVRLLG